MQPEDEFIVIGCDGIWDVMSNEEVVEFVSSYSGEPEDDVSEALIKEVLCRSAESAKLTCMVN